MEALTRAEAIVLSSLLGADWSETERARIRNSGLPRSTYQEAKRRLYQEGYILNRFVPDPHALGMRGIRFLVARPFINEIPRLVQAFAADELTTTLWVGQNSIFVAQCIPQTGIPKREESEGEVPGTLVSIEADCRPDQIPIFFDFEGALCRVAGTRRPRRYPRGLPCPQNGDRGPHPDLSPRTSLALGELLLRPFGTLGAEGSSPLVAAPFLPRSQRRVLAQGWALWKVIPSLPKHLAHDGRELRQLLVVTGRLKEGRTLAELTSTLSGQTGASPFLAAGDGTQVILGAFAGVGARSGTSRSGSVLGTLELSMEDIQVLREDLPSLEMRLDQRYDRLLHR